MQELLKELDALQDRYKIQQKHLARGLALREWVLVLTSAWQLPETGEHVKP